MGNSRWRAYGANDDFAAGAASAALLLTVALLLLAGYLVVRAVRLVARVAREHPSHRGLRVTVVCCLGAWVAVGLAASLAAPRGWTEALVVTAGLATAALLLIAKLIDLDGQELFQREHPAETLLEDVLRRPWWQDEAA